MKRKAAITGIILLALSLVAVTFVTRIAKPRIVLHAVTPDGTEICVFQRFTGTTEPFETSFYSKKPGANWGWFYYDHQDLPWLSGRIQLDTTNKTATIFRGSKAVARYDWSKDTFTHFQRGTTTEPQPSTWTPQTMAAVRK